jgi:glutathione S-transferase
MPADNPSPLPILYSFRRCPYAMRARMALFYSGVQVELREVDLSAVPDGLRALVPENPTVPVLQLPDGQVIDESWDILLWAVRQHDPDGWLGDGDATLLAAEQWIEMNDFSFKTDLDHYKYADRYPEHPAEYYRSEAEAFLQDLEQQLSENRYLLGERVSIADIGVFPFIRQFAFVDKDWFDQAPYPRVQRWLAELLASDLFAAVMEKYPVWKPGQEAVIFGQTTNAESEQIA